MSCARRSRSCGFAGILCHVWCHLHRAQLIDEVLCIVGLVGAERDGSWLLGTRLYQSAARPPRSPCSFGSAPGRRRPAGVAALHQAMSHEAEIGLLAFPPAKEPGIRIGGRGMRVVRPPLAMKSASAFATRRRSVGGLAGAFLSLRPSLLSALTLFIQAQASISARSYRRRESVDRSFFTLGGARTAARNFAAISPSSNWSRRRRRSNGLRPRHRRRRRRTSGTEDLFETLYQKPLRADPEERSAAASLKEISPAASMAAQFANTSAANSRSSADSATFTIKRIARSG